MARTFFGLSGNRLIAIVLPSPPLFGGRGVGGEGRPSSRELRSSTFSPKRGEKGKSTLRGAGAEIGAETRAHLFDEAEVFAI